MYIFFSLMAVWAIFDIIRGYRKATQKSQYLTKTLLGTGAVIVVLFLFGPFFMISPVKIGYSTIKSDSVILYYPTSHAAKSGQILEMAKEAAKKNHDFYGREDHTKVLIAVSDLDMLRFGVFPKGNGGGLPWGVVIRESRSSWNIMAHEMSHKNLSRASKIAAGPLKYPRWFDEGLASYVGVMDYYQTPAELKQELERGRYKKDITSWKGIPGMITWIYHTFYGAGSRLIYGQTYLMVKYLFDTYGQQKVYQLVNLTPKSSFDQAFSQTFGVTVDEFHQKFIEKLEI